MTQRAKSWGMLYIFGVAVVACVFLLTAVSVSAQNTNGTILGVVKDSTGGAVAGAAVTVTNTDTGLVRTGTTEDDGSYRFPALPVGNYEVKVMKDGFQVEDRKGITLEVAQEATIDVTLQVGSTGQTVTVTEEAPQVNTTGSTLGGIVEEQKIADLPLNGRNYVDLTLMQSGITQSSLTVVGTIQPLGVTGTTYSANGAPLRSNLTTLDGSIMSSVIGLNATSVLGTTLGVDGIKEYKVVTSMYTADYGLVIGGQTTMVSKSGTNQWHGDVFEYLRNSAMDARNYFDALDTTNFYGYGTDKSLTYPGKRIPPFTRNNFGGSAGGPIKKDKTFIYAVYEGLKTSIAPPITTTNSPQLGCYYGSNTSAMAALTSPQLYNSIPTYIDNATNEFIAVAGAGQIPAGTVANPYSIFTGTGTLTDTACTTPDTTAAKQANVNGVPNYVITVGCPFNGIALYSSNGCTLPLNPALSAGVAWIPRPNVAYGKNTAGQPVQVLPFNYTFPFKQLQTENYYQLRMDQTFSAKDSIFFRYTADLSHETANEDYPIIVDHYKSQGLFAAVGETHILSSTVLNTARASYSRTGLNLLSNTSPFLANNVLIPGQDMGCCSPGGSGVSGIPGAATPGDIYQNILTLSDDVFWTKGKHAFKFGALFNRFQDLLDLGFQVRGSASFSGMENYAQGDYSSIAYTPAVAGYGLERIYNYNTLGFYAQDDYRVLPRVTLNLGLRYEFMTTPTAPPGFSYVVKDPRVDPGGVPGPPFIDQSKHSFSPRLGFAWDVLGDGKTSLRGGVGIYYDIGNAGNLFAANDTEGPPLSQHATYNNSLNTPPFPFTYGQYGTFPLLNPNDSAALGLLAIRNIEYNLPQPTMAQWNLTLDRQLPWGMAVTVAYVGNEAWHQTQLTESDPTVPAGYLPNGLPYYSCWATEPYGYTLPSNPSMPVGANGECPSGFNQTGPKENQACTVNIATPTTGNLNPAPDLVAGPCYSSALLSTNGGNTNYNALQLGLTKRVTHGLNFQINYTFAHALDDGVKTILDPESTASLEAPQNLKEDYGNSYNDIRHNIRANVIYHAPDIKSDKFYAKPLHGWWFGSIVSWQTGYPMTILNGVNRNMENNIDTSDRVNLDPSFNAATAVTGNPNQWVNPTMFDAQPEGQLGNSPKGIVRGPKLMDEDLSFNKDTRVKWLGEQGNVEFRAEIFNIYNHPNFTAPSGTITLATPVSSSKTYTSVPSGQYGFGALIPATTAFQITSNSNKSRQVQLALKVVF
jgi:hypothetical protein